MSRKLFCIGGGKSNSITLKQLTEKCQNLTKNYPKIESIPETSKYDIPLFISSNKSFLP